MNDEIGKDFKGSDRGVIFKEQSRVSPGGTPRKASVKIVGLRAEI
jgi:hypothetical protein